MEITKEIVDNFWANVVVKTFPKAKIQYKSKSLFMRILGILIYFFNPNFMKDFITVIGTTVYIPDDLIENNPSGSLVVFAHEFVHMWDRTHDHRLFSLLYLSPQIWGLLSFLSFLAFINIWFLLFLGFSLCLLPWPSPWRAELEANGYAMTMYMEYYIGRVVSSKESYAAFLASTIFTTKDYYWMSWNRYKVKDMLLKKYNLLPQVHAAFNIVYKWCDTNLKNA
jgi:hypothetical protein